jgi:hypothetical protein
MKRIVLSLVAAACLATPAMAHGPRVGFYASYAPYPVYRPYYWGPPAYYAPPPPPVVYYRPYPVYPVYAAPPPPAVGFGYYSPNFSLSVGGR